MAARLGCRVTYVMSLIGTLETSRDVRFLVAVGSKPRPRPKRGTGGLFVNQFRRALGKISREQSVLHFYGGLTPAWTRSHAECFRRHGGVIAARLNAFPILVSNL